MEFVFGLIVGLVIGVNVSLIIVALINANKKN